MKKVYVTNISLQGRGELLKFLYEPIDFELKNNRETSFPIIPIIASHQEMGDEVKVLAIRSNHTGTLDNYAVFLEELNSLGISGECIKEINMAENQGSVENLKLLMAVLEEIPEEALIYGDITYGTKPMAAILLYAMGFAEKMKNCEVDGIYYGEIRREDDKSSKGFLYDLTIIKLLEDLIDEMKGMGIQKMQEAINRLIAL